MYSFHICMRLLELGFYSFSNFENNTGHGLVNTIVQSAQIFIMIMNKIILLI